MKTKKTIIFITICFIAQIIAIISSFILVSNIKEIHLENFGFFDTQNYYICICQIIFIPLFFMLMYLFKKNSIHFKIISFLLATVFIIRGFALINMLYSNNVNLEDNSFKLYYYIQIAVFIFTGFSIIFFALSQKKHFVFFLKICSIFGIIINAFMLLMFSLNISQINIKVTLLLLLIILIDLFSFIELLVIKSKKDLVPKESEYTNEFIS